MADCPQAQSYSLTSLADGEFQALPQPVEVDREVNAGVRASAGLNKPRPQRFHAKPRRKLYGPVMR